MLDPRLNFVTVIRELRAEVRLADFRLDSLVVREGRRIVSERCKAFAGQQKYEPESEVAS